ncbi:MAG TPA: ABC transporter transmembrane domain-containing protein, partial [Polyangiaceae bacterium]|nr:ABC transporter transmembrane domain-containing protein [Polyangiaceae bacterium]
IGVAVDVVVSKKQSFLARAGWVDPYHQLFILTAATVAVWVLESWFEYLYEIRWRGLAQDLQHRLRMDAYRHVQRLDLGWFESRRTGNLMSVLSDDINQMERFLNGGANDLIQVAVGTLMVGFVFVGISPTIALLAGLPIPLVIYGAFWFQSRLGPRYAGVREAAGALSARLNNNLLGIATIKAYATEDYEAARITDDSNAYREQNALAIRFSSAITPVIRMAVLLGFTITLLYGGILALRGDIGVGSYSVLVYLTQRLLWPLTRLADMTDLYQRSMASVARVMDLVDTKIGIDYAGKPVERQQVHGQLTLDHVTFSYDDMPILRDVSLTLAAGKTTAFVGPTGSGK